MKVTSPTVLHRWGRCRERRSLLIAEAHDRRIPLTLERLDVDAWLALTVEAYAPLFEERGAELHLRTQGGTIAADRTLLDRVVLNLLENALRYGCAGGRVELSAERSEGKLRIAVDDAGPGIAREHRERVFERFERINASVTEVAAHVLATADSDSPRASAAAADAKFWVNALVRQCRSLHDELDFLAPWTALAAAPSGLGDLMDSGAMLFLTHPHACT